MKRKILVFLFTMCLVLSGSMFIISCGGGDEDGATTLGTPFVSISTDGVASWNEVENASGYTYKIDDGTETNTTELSVQLTDGQSIVVKAVGDGVNYSDSSYSASQTYNANTSNPGDTTDPGDSTTPGGDTTDPGDSTTPGGDTTDPGDSTTPGGDTTDPGDSTTPGGDTTDPGDSTTPGGDTTDPGDSTTPGVDTITPDDPTDIDEKALTEPVITVNSSGLASWTAITNAVGYKYKINDGSEVSTTATSIQLTDGQKIVVKAVGDGTVYLDSPYSTSKTYIVAQANAPQFLGLEVTTEQPDGTSTVSLAVLNGDSATTDGVDGWVDSSVNDDIKDYLNSSLTILPSDTNYDLYTTQDTIIYVKILLNNPEQYTILSLRINGHKFQIGGGLQSYFEGDINCVYVAIKTPTGVNASRYQVTEIEYVEDSSVSSNGKQVFIGDNDTVTVGLAYEVYPTVSEFANSSNSCYSVSYTFDVADTDMVISKSKGYFCAVVYDGDTVVDQKVLTTGVNNITFENLNPNTNYQVLVVGYYDKLDGNGVSLIVYASEDIKTKGLVEFVDENTYGDYAIVDGQSKAKIDIETILYDTSKSYEKIAIYLDGDDDVVSGGTIIDGTVIPPTTEGEEISGADGSVTVIPGSDGTVDGVVGGVTTTPKEPTFVYTKTQLEEMGFDGTYSFTDGILNNKTYVIRVYYSDTDYVRKVVTTPEYKVPILDNNYYNGGISFKTHAMIGLDVCLESEEDRNETFEDYTLSYGIHLDGYLNGEKIYSFTYDSSNDADFFDSGLYFYGNSFGTTYRRNSYFIVLRDYFNLNADDRSDISWEAYVTADLNDGNGEQQFDVYSLWYNPSPSYINGYGVIVNQDEDDNNRLTITEEYDPSRGFIYKASLFNMEGDVWEKDIYIKNDEFIDEQAWIDYQKQLLFDRANDSEYFWGSTGREDETGKEFWDFQSPYSYWNNEDIFPSAESYLDSLQHTPEVVDFTANLSGLGGYYRLRVYFRYNDKVYADGEGELCYEKDYAFSAYIGPLDTPVVTIDYRTARWNEIENAVAYKVYINDDTEGFTVGQNYYELLNHNETIRVVALAYFDDEPNSGMFGLAPIYSHSAKSTEKTCILPTLSTPTISVEGYCIRITAVENADTYIALINGTEEREVSDWEWFEPGTTIKIKAHNYSGEYGDSNWTATVTISSKGADEK